LNGAILRRYSGTVCGINERIRFEATRFGIGFRQQGTSHVTFRHPAGGVVVVPAYVRKFVALIDSSAKSA